MLALVACSSKKNNDAAGSATAETKPVETKPVDCPPGQAAEAGKCIAVVTAEKVEVVAQQQTRLEELAKLLEQAEVVAAPIELLDGFRQTEEWKTLAAKSAELRVVDTAVETLDTAVKELREFRTGLGEASTRLGNLKGELARILAEPGTARRIEDVRAKISGELRGAIEPLAKQTADTIQNALTPLAAKLSEWSDLVVTACTLGKVSGGGEKMKDLCAQAKGVFAKAVTFVEDVKARPAKLYDEVSEKLETELALLVDTESKKLLDAAQTQVNAALNLPPAGSATGSAAAGSSVN